MLNYKVADYVTLAVMHAIVSYFLHQPCKFKLNF
ncbi:unnamed protein product [Brugia timori]|uniref:Uncharacterized protein n=1 Tax=Brugia timori TaxID=42155 RepID=A0A3P7UAF6_9BILA|nr:unnamed protein product [Brugia timori]